MHWNDIVLQQLPPEVAAFVAEALRQVEQAGTCDAPGVIGSVLHQMRGADSALVRAAAPLTEVLMLSALAPRAPERLTA